MSYRIMVAEDDGDIVHVLKDGKIVTTAGRELVDEIEEKGYDIF